MVRYIEKEKEPEQPPEEAPETPNKEVSSFAGHLSDLGKAASASQEAESTLESLATLAKGIEKWMMVRAQIQDQHKSNNNTGKTDPEKTVNDLIDYNNNINNPNQDIGTGTGTDFESFVNTQVASLNGETNIPATVVPNWKTNMNTLAKGGAIPGNKTYYNNNKYQQQIKESINKKPGQTPAMSAPGMEQSVVKSIQQQDTQTTTPETAPITEPIANTLQETTPETVPDPTVENIDIQEAEINTQSTTPGLESDPSVEQVNIERPESLDITDATGDVTGDVANNLKDILDKNKLSSLLGKAT
tara:strand:+ start:67 stop:972 length:906 start_codon:yes stop_codon:yes gene_type:complete